MDAENVGGLTGKVIVRATQLCVCVGHGTGLSGWKSPIQVLAEPKARRRVRLRRIIVRWGLEAARSAVAGSPIQRCGVTTGTRFEVWYIRDELARDKNK
ncbi:MAG: hypothetical protein Q8O60_10080 [Deltaproteobacteria bacterium]|nr:hypothetical protein [Deltaproteobacteria bacterium]